ncbi:MAG: hypothetical protein QM536_04105 [Chitinophagaceae bacterium]|nr:hypothetical protein [Chitinophagaceae bacterium]
MLKKIIYALGALVAIFIIAMFAFPTKYHIERSIVINAHMGLVQEMTSKYMFFAKWNPWAKMDSTMTYTITPLEKDGKVGCVYAWKGNQTGSGSLEIMERTENKIEQKLTFIDFNSVSKTCYTFEQQAEGVKVTWDMDGENPKPMNIMAAIMGMEKMLNSQYESGLASLKEMVESATKQDVFLGQKVELINFTDATERAYLIKRANVKMSDVASFCKAGFTELATLIQKKKINPIGTFCGIYFQWNPETQDTDMAVAVPIQINNIKNTPNIEGFTIQTIPPQTQATKVIHKGSYETMIPPHEASALYLLTRNLSQDVVIEEYITDPEVEKDTTQWITNVFYLVKK